MKPTIIDLNITKTLSHPIIKDGITISEVHLNKLILRPILKRIVFMTDKLDRVIIYEGETDYEAHKGDSQETLITKLLEVIDTTNTHA